MKKIKIDLIDITILIIIPITLVIIDNVLNNRAKTLIEIGEYAELETIISNMLIMNSICILFLVVLFSYAFFIRRKRGR